MKNAKIELMPSGDMLAGSISRLLLILAMAMSTTACIIHEVYKDLTSKEQRNPVKRSEIRATKEMKL